MTICNGTHGQRQAMLRSDRDHWGSVAKAFHWLIVALILAQVVLGIVMVNLPRRPSVIPVFDVHKSIGLTILALALLRLAWRAFDPHPVRPPDVSTWQYRIGRLVHIMLYVLIFITPLSGWLFDSTNALRPLHWWGLVTIPSLTGGPVPEWVDFTRSLHHTLVWVLVAVAAGHMFAALIHHYFYKDNILRRMLPRGRLKQEAPPS